VRDSSRNPKEADISTSDLVKRLGGEAMFVKTDVTDSESVDALVGQVVDRWGRVDMYGSQFEFHVRCRRKQDIPEQDGAS